jgi:tryptophan synthase alpha chain
MGVTGARDRVGSAAHDVVRRARVHTDLPIGVGLGVRSGAQAAELAAYADAVIVGSAFVSRAAEGVEPVRALAAELAAGVRSSVPAGQPL